MNLFCKALGYVYGYTHPFFTLKGLHRPVRASGSSVDLTGEAPIQVRDLISCWLQCRGRVQSSLGMHRMGFSSADGCVHVPSV